MNNTAKIVNNLIFHSCRYTIYQRQCSYTSVKQAYLKMLRQDKIQQLKRSSGDEAMQY